MRTKDPLSVLMKTVAQTPVPLMPLGIAHEAQDEYSQQKMEVWPLLQTKLMGKTQILALMDQVLHHPMDMAPLLRCWTGMVLERMGSFQALTWALA
mmetsp:Transcript_75842/g.180144  ORF Transcript_75842/g.180144 Transcript_75842/m.180144 type:complete len:96 (-) Transcript_75842:1898-2185(-)